MISINIIFVYEKDRQAMIYNILFPISHHQNNHTSHIFTGRFHS